MSSHQALAFKGFTYQDDPPMGFAVGWNRMLMTLIHKFEVVRTQLVDQFVSIRIRRLTTFLFSPVDDTSAGALFRRQQGDNQDV